MADNQLSDVSLLGKAPHDCGRRMKRVRGPSGDREMHDQHIGVFGKVDELSTGLVGTEDD
jgi:hypothetical protein